MDDLKTGVEKGNLALYVLTGATWFSNVEVRRPRRAVAAARAKDGAGHADDVERLARV